MMNNVLGMSKIASIHSIILAEATKQSGVEMTAIDEVSTRRELVNYVKTNPGYTPTLQEKTIITALEKVNEKLSGADTELEYSVHEKTNRIMVKVIDKQTKEIVREVPPEKMVDMSRNFVS